VAACSATNSAGTRGEHAREIGVGIRVRRVALGRLEDVAELRRGELLVRQAAERGAHLAVDSDRARRHVDTLVPLDEIGGVLQVLHLADERVEPIQ
jgi:hypothetical protein